jgi:hypothetical protein
MDSKQQWERVLAAVEADARRTEALLATAGADVEVPAPQPDAVPANWQLPTVDTSQLPPLSQMPPVPKELRDRILALRSRIIGLQGELAQALREWRPPAAAIPAGASIRPPVYVDRCL